MGGTGGRRCCCHCCCTRQAARRHHAACSQGTWTGPRAFLTTSASAAKIHDQPQGGLWGQIPAAPLTCLRERPSSLAPRGPSSVTWRRLQLLIVTNNSLGLRGQGAGPTTDLDLQAQLQLCPIRLAQRPAGQLLAQSFKVPRWPTGAWHNLSIFLSVTAPLAWPRQH